MSDSTRTPGVLLVGGGSGGPVAPLLALAQHMQAQKTRTRFLVVGTPHGPEGQMAATAGIPFVAIQSGKFRRYWSVKTLLAPLQVLTGLFQSLRILSGFKPSVVVGAGSFVQVPMCYAAWCKRIPVVIHQQDVLRSLSNILCAPIATKITVSLEGSVKEFSQGFNLFATKRSAKIFHTGNPVRTSVLHGHRSEAKTYFRFVSDLPTLLVTGGGTGAEFLNLLVKETLPQLCKVFNVIHIYGRQKTAATSSEGYFATPFLDRMDLVYAISDIVVTRAGLSTISELANLGKVSILIPMPNTHQEANAFYLGQLGAALVLAQEEIIPEQFLTTLSSLRLDGDRQKELSQNIRSIMPHDSVSRMEKIINTVIHGQ